MYIYLYSRLSSSQLNDPVLLAIGDGACICFTNHYRILITTCLLHSGRQYSTVRVSVTRWTSSVNLPRFIHQLLIYGATNGGWGYDLALFRGISSSFLPPSHCSSWFVAGWMSDWVIDWMCLLGPPLSNASMCGAGSSSKHIREWFPTNVQIFIFLRAPLIMQCNWLYVCVSWCHVDGKWANCDKILATNILGILFYTYM